MNDLTLIPAEELIEEMGKRFGRFMFHGVRRRITGEDDFFVVYKLKVNPKVGRLNIVRTLTRDR